MSVLLRVCFVLILALRFSQTAIAELPEGFGELHQQLAPKKEAWKTIAWHVDLLSAQNQAARERKPIFIWSMDGHPLGCT